MSRMSRAAAAVLVAAALLLTVLAIFGRLPAPPGGTPLAQPAQELTPLVKESAPPAEGWRAARAKVKAVILHPLTTALSIFCAVARFFRSVERRREARQH